MTLVDDLWYSRSEGAQVARAMLSPLSALYGIGVSQRARGYEREGAVLTPAVPAMSIGNVSVGGTGKTTVAAWAAHTLVARGAHPAIVMRGYGDDEPLVHAKLNADVPVFVNPDRVEAIAEAAHKGADCAILDDAFQHRRVARVADLVLVAAEQWREDARLLPAGPLREPVTALARATVAIVTRKSATAAAAAEIGERIARIAPAVSRAQLHLRASGIVDAHTGAAHGLAELHGARVVAVAAIGAPEAFFAQLRAEGARVDARAFADHHPYSERDIAGLVAFAGGVRAVVCTLKDAVKLAPRWPRAAAPLWYVSQTVVIESGDAVLDHAFETVLAARRPGS